MELARAKAPVVAQKTPRNWYRVRVCRIESIQPSSPSQLWLHYMDALTLECSHTVHCMVEAWRPRPRTGSVESVRYIGAFSNGKERVMVGYVIPFSTAQKCLTDLSLSALFPSIATCAPISIHFYNSFKLLTSGLDSEI